MLNGAPNICNDHELNPVKVIELVLLHVASLDFEQTYEPAWETTLEHTIHILTTRLLLGSSLRVWNSDS